MGSRICKGQGRRIRSDKTKKTNISRMLSARGTKGNTSLRDRKLEDKIANHLYRSQERKESSDVKEQVKIDLKINHKKVGQYKIDFTYMRGGVRHWVEVKGYFWARDVLRFKMFLATIPDGDVAIISSDIHNNKKVRLSDTGMLQIWDELRLIWTRWTRK